MDEEVISVAINWASVFDKLNPADRLRESKGEKVWHNPGTSFVDALLKDANKNVEQRGVSFAKDFGPPLARAAIAYPALAAGVALLTPQGRAVATSVISGGANALFNAPDITIGGGKSEEKKIDTQADTSGLWGASPPTDSEVRPGEKKIVKRKAVKRKAVKRKAVKRKAVKRKAVKRKAVKRGKRKVKAR